MFLSWLQGDRRKLLIRAGLLTAIIALADWYLEQNISVGFLYIFPMLIVGSVSPRWQVAVAATVCTMLEELFDPFPWALKSASVPQDILIFSAFLGMGLFAFELSKNHRLTIQYTQDVETESTLRRETEQELNVLIESSPVSILTLDCAGRVVLANEAAHRLLGFSGQALRGEPITSYLPALATVPLDPSAHVFKTMMECRGHRRDGEMFLAEVWLSTYSTRSAPRLAAIIVDVSDWLCEGEELNWQRFVVTRGIVVGAVSHEIRNICGAITEVCANLARHPALPRNKGFRALGSLVDRLVRIASAELFHGARQQGTRRLPTALIRADDGHQESVNARTFTERERAVLAGVFEGMSNKEIAARLNISESSVKSALQQLFRKAGVRTRSQLVRVALEERFVESGAAVSKYGAP